MTDDELSCEEFQNQMADLVSTGGGTAIYSHPHLRSCETCRALLVELDMIAENARPKKPYSGI